MCAKLSVGFIDMDEFISEIEKQPAIWRVPFVVKEYEKSWDALYMKFIFEYDLWETPLRNDAARALKKKWNYLCDIYFKGKKIRQSKQNTSELTATQWKYFQKLSFLSVLEKEETTEEDTCPKGSVNKEEEDPNRYFLLSLLPDIKSMNDHSKLDFKTDMLVLLKKYQNKEL